MKYKVVKDLGLSQDAPEVGDVVIKSELHDYGMRSDHELSTGKPHINITRDGDYPLFTVPVECVEAVSQ